MGQAAEKLQVLLRGRDVEQNTALSGGFSVNGRP